MVDGSGPAGDGGAPQALTEPERAVGAVRMGLPGKALPIVPRGPPRVRAGPDGAAGEQGQDVRRIADRAAQYLGEIEPWSTVASGADGDLGDDHRPLLDGDLDAGWPGPVLRAPNPGRVGRSVYGRPVDDPRNRGPPRDGPKAADHNNSAGFAGDGDDSRDVRPRTAPESAAASGEVVP